MPTGPQVDALTDLLGTHTPIVVLQTHDEKRVLDAGRVLAAIAHGRETGGVRIQVDANPVNML